MTRVALVLAVVLAAVVLAGQASAASVPPVPAGLRVVLVKGGYAYKGGYRPCFAHSREWCYVSRLGTRSRVAAHWSSAREARRTAAAIAISRKVARAAEQLFGPKARLVGAYAWRSYVVFELRRRATS